MSNRQRRVLQLVVYIKRHKFSSNGIFFCVLSNGRITEGYYRGVNLYVFHVSLTDFHCFDWLTDVRGNPYGFKKKIKIKKKNLFFNFFF